MLLVARAAARERRLVRSAMEWRQRVGARVAAAVLTRLVGRGRRRLRVWVVAVAAPALVRIVRRHEAFDHALHRVTAEAVLVARHQLGERHMPIVRVAHRDRESVAGRAVKACLIGHLAESNAHRLVAAGLLARRLDRDETMRGDAVAGETLDAEFLRGIGLEVHGMTRGGDDALPCAIGLALDVATRADVARDRGVRTDLLRSQQHPFHDLVDFSDERLVVAIVAAEIGDAMMLGLLKALIDLVVQRVAGDAELVVVLRVDEEGRAAGGHAGEHADGDEADDDLPGNRRLGVTGAKPGANRPRVSPNEHDRDNGDDHREHGAGQLDPARHAEEGPERAFHHRDVAGWTEYRHRVARGAHVDVQPLSGKRLQHHPSYGKLLSAAIDAPSRQDCWARLAMALSGKRRRPNVHCRRLLIGSTI